MNSEEIEQIIRQSLPSNGITEPVLQVIISDAGLKGEGVASLTQYVTVNFEDPEKKPLNLFVKVKPGSEAHQQWLDEIKAFEKEARFLTDYVKAAKEVCKQKGRPDFIDFYPKCYYADQKIIVLENLVLEKGYSLKNKEEGQNLEDAKFAIRTLAKHHAIGYVMITENGGPQKFFERFPNLDMEAYTKQSIIDLFGTMLNNSVEPNVKILEKNLQIPGAKETAEKLKQFVGKPMSIILEALKITENKYQTSFHVLGHGDYWNNNMMFLVDKLTNKNVHHVAIDFQITRYNSPALDLTHYFFASVQPNIRRAHLMELLTLYKNTVNKVTAEFGHPTNLTSDGIFKDFREKLGYGFWIGFLWNVGPGLTLFKNVDISKVDANEWPVIMDGLVNKWIDENPEKGKKTAQDIIELIKEYEQLRI